jgi:hypothetical protein
MKKEDVHIGGRYTAKVTNKLVTVEILSESRFGGWDAKNLATGKQVRIKSAAKLRREVTKTAGKPDKPHTAAQGAMSRPKPSQPADAEQTLATGEPEPQGAKRLSALDAAAKVLAEAAEPLNCKQMIEAMMQKDYWQPAHSGKTPANTLHAAIATEIKKKGAAARFEKVGRGQFGLRSST